MQSSRRPFGEEHRREGPKSRPYACSRRASHAPVAVRSDATRSLCHSLPMPFALVGPRSHRPSLHVPVRSRCPLLLQPFVPGAPRSLCPFAPVALRSRRPSPPFVPSAARCRASPLRTTSVTRWEVRTLPPTTAACSDGRRRQPGGMRMVMGVRQPWLSGMSLATRQRRQ